MLLTLLMLWVKLLLHFFHFLFYFYKIFPLWKYKRHNSFKAYIYIYLVELLWKSQLEKANNLVTMEFIDLFPSVYSWSILSKNDFSCNLLFILALTAFLTGFSQLFSSWFYYSIQTFLDNLTYSKINLIIWNFLNTFILSNS